MPQMGPISWLTLFVIFSISFILMNMMNYFSTINIPKKIMNLKKIQHNTMQWKW